MTLLKDLLCHRRILSGKKIIASFILAIFFVSSITPVGAQMVPVSGTRVGLISGLATDGLGIPSDIASRSSVSFQPPVLLGLKIHPENPLLFDFIVDQGESRLSEDDLKAETEKLVKYFLAALTIPDKEVWVNLSPYEKDRIIPDVLGQTTMGKTMLEQDYLLKQLASSLTNPEEKLGQEFWGKVKAQVGGSDVPMNTFNKVWIVPQKAEVLESQGIVLVGEKRLKVMMADDYTAMNMSSPQSQSLSSPNAQSLSSPQSLSGDPLAKNGFPIKDFGNDKNIKAFGNDNSNVSSQVFRDVILPNIEKEINEGKNFADVRQIYNSVILAAWYKKALKESLLGKVYTDKGKVAGVETDDKDMKQRIYEQYLSAFKKGVYNLIKEESDVISGDIIPRKYFSGGENFADVASIISSSTVTLPQAGRLISNKKTQLAKVQMALEQHEFDQLQSRVNVIASTGVFERDNYIFLRSGKLFEEMRINDVKELSPVDVDPKDMNFMYHAFNRVYEALSNRVIEEIIAYLSQRNIPVNDGDITIGLTDKIIRGFVEKIVTAKSEVHNAWMHAAQSNPLRWNTKEAIKSRSNQILTSVGLGGSHPLHPRISEKLILSLLDREFLNKWHNMNKPPESASSSIRQDERLALGPIANQFLTRFMTQEEAHQVPQDIRDFVAGLLRAAFLGGEIWYEKATFADGAQGYAVKLKQGFTIFEYKANQEIYQKIGVLDAQEEFNLVVLKVSPDFVRRIEEEGGKLASLYEKLAFQRGVKTALVDVERKRLIYTILDSQNPENSLKNFEDFVTKFEQEELFFAEVDAHAQQLEISPIRDAMIEVTGNDAAMREVLLLTFDSLEKAFGKDTIFLSGEFDYIGFLYAIKAAVKEEMQFTVNDEKSKIDRKYMLISLDLASGILNTNDVQKAIADFGTFTESFLNDLFVITDREVLREDFGKFEYIGAEINAHFDKLLAISGEIEVALRQYTYILGMAAGYLSVASSSAESDPYFSHLKQGIEDFTGIRYEGYYVAGIKGISDTDKYKAAVQLLDPNGTGNEAEYQIENLVSAIQEAVSAHAEKAGQDLSDFDKRNLVRNSRYFVDQFIGFVENNPPIISSSGVTTEQSKIVASAPTIERVGGIDFDPTNMNLQIKRDGRGVPLPLPQQNLEQINIQGLFPVIINIVPVNAQTLPIFLGQAPAEPAREPELAMSTVS
ncbi:MAG: hypothetical protein H6754_07785 [Candidatus Omnitrophica bacterium]|nr:hypothetical protein [Candidatus Omnitrophota bacterium]